MGITFKNYLKRSQKKNQKKLQIFPEILEKLEYDQGVSTEVIDMICGLLQCQPGDIMEYLPEN